MRRTLKEKLDLISMDLTTIRLMVADLHRGLVPKSCSSIKESREDDGLNSAFREPGDDLADAIRTLREYCDTQDTCRACVFGNCRDDCGFICRVNQLVSDERYERAVGAKKEPQPQLWRED